jgi:hypothetical protein
MLPELLQLVKRGGFAPCASSLYPIPESEPGAVRRVLQCGACFAASYSTELYRVFVSLSTRFLRVACRAMPCRKA